MRTLSRWDHPPYRRIQQAWCEGDTLVVRFQDRSEARADIRDVVPPGYSQIQWDKLTSTDMHISVPAHGGPDGVLDIPWDVIRRATDPEYAAHWEALSIAAEQQLGRRLWELRDSRSLSRDDLAARAGIGPELLERIEQGDPAVYAHLSRLLDGLGVTDEVLIERPRRARKRRTVA